MDKNKDKKVAKMIYSDLITCIGKVNQNFFNFNNNNFDETFEITSIILFCILNGMKNRSEQKYKKLNQDLMDIFINDLDYSFRNLGIGDMSIGKYTKKYVKKFYYRLSKLDVIFSDNDFNKFYNYLIVHKLVSQNINSKMLNKLFEDLNMLIFRAKNNNEFSLLYRDLFN